jgi:hypothetical protein
MAQQTRDATEEGGRKSILDELPIDRLKDELQDVLAAAGEHVVGAAGEKISGLTGRLTGFTENGGILAKAATGGGKEALTGGSVVKGLFKGGGSGVMDKVKGIFGGGKGGGQKKATKATNIVETIDVGVPITVAYNQWTQFQDFSGFMKKVESVEQASDEKLNWKAKIVWSHRTWEATILDQVPDQQIVWRSKGPKGHVDGSVTFHELAPNLTRILLVMEYYPQGLFERTGNIWRAQGRRSRLELKHYRRHVMNNVILQPDEVEGWRGEIHDSQVVRTHEEALEEQENEEEPEDEYDEEEEEPEGEEGPEDEYDEVEEDEEEAPEDEDEYDEEEAPEDEYDEEAEDEEEAPEDEYEEEEAEDEEEPEDEYDEEAEDEEEAPEDEYDEVEEEEEEEEEAPEDEYDEEEEEAPEDEYEEEYDEEEPEDEYDEYDEEEPEESESRPRRLRSAS